MRLFAKVSESPKSLCFSITCENPKEENHTNIILLLTIKITGTNNGSLISLSIIGFISPIKRHRL